MKNKIQLKLSDIISFLKKGLMKEEKMTEERAEEFLNNFSTETLIKLYSALNKVDKKRGKNNE